MCRWARATPSYNPALAFIFISQSALSAETKAETHPWHWAGKAALSLRAIFQQYSECVCLSWARASLPQRTQSHSHLHPETSQKRLASGQNTWQQPSCISRRTENRLKMISHLGQSKDSVRKQKNWAQTWDLTQGRDGVGKYSEGAPLNFSSPHQSPTYMVAWDWPLNRL